MENKLGQKLIDELKAQGFEVDWDWDEENHASLSKTEEGKVLMVELQVSKEEITS